MNYRFQLSFLDSNSRLLELFLGENVSLFVMTGGYIMLYYILFRVVSKVILAFGSSFMGCG